MIIRTTSVWKCQLVWKCSQHRKHFTYRSGFFDYNLQHLQVAIYFKIVSLHVVTQNPADIFVTQKFNDCIRLFDNIFGLQSVRVCVRVP